MQLAKRQARKCRRRVAENRCGKAVLAKLKIVSYYIAMLAKIIRGHLLCNSGHYISDKRQCQIGDGNEFCVVLHGVATKGIMAFVELHIIFVTQL